MTIGHKPAPQHGGLTRVAFDGGSSVRGELSFNAIAVNIDNWSPYWYKLNPIEEYIPPFQHGVNISLPLIHSYEFVCQAPPGLLQVDITATSGIPGNNKPLIAVFSSFPTNNDAGTSALETSANVAIPYVFFNGAQNVPIDVTLYDGIYLSINVNANTIVEIQDSDVAVGGAITTRYRRIMYVNQRLLLVIPKLTKYIRVLFTQDTNRGAAPSGSYSIRPFFGALPFSAQLSTPPSIGVPQDAVTIVGKIVTEFTTVGLDNVVISITPNGGAGVTLATSYWVKVIAKDYGIVGVQPNLLYSRVFRYGLNPNLLLPVSGLLSRQVEELSIEVNPIEGAVTLGTAITVISLHQGTAEALEMSAYSNPPPYTVGNTSAVAGGAALTPIFTLPSDGGMLRSIDVNNTVVSATAGAVCAFYMGTGAGVPLVFLGAVPLNIIGRFTLNSYAPFRLEAGLNTLIAQNTAAAAQNMNWYITLD